MTKLEVAELLLAFGPGILALAVYGWFLRRILFRKPDIRTLDVCIRRRLFLAAAFWPFAASISGTMMMILLAWCMPGGMSFLFGLVLSYAVGMLLLFPWYPLLPFLGRARDLPNRKMLVSLFRFSLSGAISLAFVAWTVVCMGISGGYLGEHFLEGGPRSPLRLLLEAVNDAPVYDAPAPHIRRDIQCPRHSFCILCHLEQGCKHVEMRSKWREVSKGGEEQQIGVRDAMSAAIESGHGVLLRGE